MKNVHTAQGKRIDMAALARAHEERRAVSPGALMNGRGDRIEPSGQVKKTVQAVTREVYETKTPPVQKTVNNLPGAPKTNRKPRKKPLQPDGTTVVREEEITRQDGSVYVEVEYADGSIEIKESK